MPINLELKIPLLSFNEVEKLLSKYRIKKEKIIKQKDIYYKNKKALLKMRIEDGKYYLIKYNRDEKKTRWSNYQIIELTGERIEKYFSEVLEPIVTVEKVRRLYLYNNTRIHLDDVKKLGKFLELETVVSRNKNFALNEFNKIVSMLNLNVSSQIRASYKDLLLNKNLRR
ncbi:CYTH domain-containing protein [Melioribacteraceae bacterium 4301-Me]|uniref:CYTH domain-containing protein n=1 Tax=Pyranulibacter aquaticus TaxID=3163344 RepID=UPI0035973A24